MRPLSIPWWFIAYVMAWLLGAALAAGVVLAATEAAPGIDALLIGFGALGTLFAPAFLGFRE